MATRRMTVIAALLCAGSAVRATPALAAEPSGAAWVSRFPGSKRIGDLDAGFRSGVEAFSSALKQAGATMTVTSTLRPKERAYLMHWSWEIARNGHDPERVPALAGVDIAWWHGDAAASKRAAREMVDAYGIGHLGVAPALASRHTEGKAIDMQLTWTGTLTVKTKNGKTTAIEDGPRDSTNPELIRVGKTYGVIHFRDVPKDRVHWSTDGR